MARNGTYYGNSSYRSNNGGSRYGGDAYARKEGAWGAASEKPKAEGGAVTQKPAGDFCRDRKPEMMAWHVSERDGKSFWIRIGAAWRHEDGKGMTLTLEALPVQGRIVLRAPNAEMKTRHPVSE